MTKHIKLDEELLNLAVKIGKHKTPQAAVEAALREYVQLHSESWTNWIGKVPYFDDYDYKANRKKKGSK